MIISKDIQEKILNLKPIYLPSSVDKFFSWQELEFLLNLRPFVNIFRFKPTNFDPLEWGTDAWISDSNSLPPSVINYYISKHVCYLHDASRVNKQVNQICNELEKLFDSAADAHIYFYLGKDFSGNPQGFHKHNDSSHNFIVQIEGTTNFKVWDLDDTLIIDTIMTPGDSIFIPEKYYHYAHSLEKRLSISFPIIPKKIKPQDRLWIDIKNKLQEY